MFEITPVPAWAASGIRKKRPLPGAMAVDCQMVIGDTNDPKLEFRFRNPSGDGSRRSDHDFRGNNWIGCNRSWSNRHNRVAHCCS